MKKIIKYFLEDRPEAVIEFVSIFIFASLITGFMAFLFAFVLSNAFS